MRPADSLLARAAQLLDWRGCCLASKVNNYELLDALAAGGELGFRGDSCLPRSLLG